MKNFFKYLIVLVALGVSGFLVWDTIQPICSKGLEFDIGVVDTGFGISEADFKAASLEAAAIWNKEIGYEVITFDKNSGFDVSLIYDERQERTDFRIESEGEIDDTREGLDEALSGFEEKQANFEKAESTYQANSQSYKQAQAAYNAKVESINASGGATPSQQAELAADRQGLDNQFRSLEEERKALNKLASSINAEAGSVNGIIKEFNENIQDFNQEFSDQEEFNQGVYDGIGINIYQYENYSDLVAVLAHEFGHALGLGHVEGELSIMYYRQHDSLESNIILSNDDKFELSASCPSYSI